jgi:putative tricarboxylic transport membrane protein
MDKGLKSGVQRDAIAGTRAVEVATSLGLLVFGLVVVSNSLRIGSGWAPDGPEAGFYPFYVGLVLCVASAFVLVTHARKGAGPAFVGRLELSRVLCVLLPAMLYVAGLYLLGMYVSSLLFLSGFMHWLGKYSWLKALALGTAIVAGLFAMFELWFNVPLPKGPLEVWLGY